MLILIFTLLFFFLVSVAFIFYAFYKAVTLFFGAPFVVSSDERTRDIMKLLKPRPGEKIIDLGSGDGKLMFEIARAGAKAYGVEINPILVWQTKRIAKKLGLANKILVKRGNLFREDLKQYDAIVIYGITYVMPRLEKKLLKELKPGTRIVSNYFQFPSLKPVKKSGEVLLYKV